MGFSSDAIVSIKNNRKLAKMPNRPYMSYWSRSSQSEPFRERTQLHDPALQRASRRRKVYLIGYLVMLLLIFGLVLGLVWVYC